MTSKKASRLIIIANRLPVKAEINDDRISFQKSAGGLATGLDSLNSTYEKHWIGWPGVYAPDSLTEDKIANELEKINLHPVFLSESDIELYYEGYSNSTLWPLFHYFYVYIRHDPEYWQAYKKVNLQFLNSILSVVSENDVLWVHDYHLMLLPGMIREHLPSVKIGFFLHIPFPSYELFRTLNDREELLEGLLGADLVGFHTFSYMRHFVSTMYRIKGIESDDNTFHYKNRTLSVDTFPMGIDFASFNNAGQLKEVKEGMATLRRQYPGQKIILFVDRLDYSKGLIQRLEAFRIFLQNFPQWIGRVSLVMILVPSRDSVDRYHDLKTKIDETIGNINGAWSQPGWIPINYFYKSFSFYELSAFYITSDVALVTPLRDGMNLVAKEYVASRNRKGGALILSEMAGAATELSDSILVNPNNTTLLADAIHQALTMPAAEQKERMARMQKIIRRQDIARWAEDFINALEEVHRQQGSILMKNLNKKEAGEIRSKFISSGKRLFILDYDGTLVPFHKDPAKALPPEYLLELIKEITQTENLEIAIISGRNSEFLDLVFPDPSITIFAEHGARQRLGGVWKELFRKQISWQNEIIKIMQEVTNTTPGSGIEKKETAIVWHYRNTDRWLADLRAAQLVNKLIYPCTRRQLHLMRGNKIIEVKPSEYTKGSAIRSHFEYALYDFILAAGDDTTDEDMFDVLPKSAITIKIGKPSEKARFTITDSGRFVKFLGSLLKKGYEN